MLEIKSLFTEFFKPLSLKLASGEIVALRGASGSGKSLFLRAVVDLDPSEGEVFLDDEERNSFKANIWRSLVAYVPAQTGWWEDIVGEHFEQTSGLDELFLALDLPIEALNWQVRRLSSGERQRLGFIRAILQKPKVLLLDEPTSALDEKTTLKFEKLIKQQAKNGVSIIIVTHDERQAKRLTSKTYLLDAGTLKLLKGKDNG